MEGESPEIYHERQRKHLCALHVLNNLLQKEAFKQSDLDDICTRLTPQNYFNPHRSVLGLGNYDVNVVTAALQTKDLCVVWFDKRKNVGQLDFSKLKGIILNVPSGFLGLPIDLNFKHWIVVREVNGTYYNFDSKLSKPEALGGTEDLVTYLREKTQHKKTQMLLVVDQEVDQAGSWYSTEAGNQSSTNGNCDVNESSDKPRVEQEGPNSDGDTDR